VRPALERETRHPLGMSALKGRVENGRLKLDEPTDLPDSTVVPLEIAEDWDDLDEEERAALHESIREGIEDLEAGRTIDARKAIAELRSRL
jgi:predicted transcriptional regulator